MLTDIVILAAGQGTRMRSGLPKVLQALGGKPMLAHVLATAAELLPRRIHVVTGFGGDAVQAAFPDAQAIWWTQAQQLGTGDALKSALPGLTGAERVLVLYGDVPLLTVATLREFLQQTPASALGLTTASLSVPHGYGRILRDADGQVQGIREHKDCQPDERVIREVNLGMMILPVAPLQGWLQGLSARNAQGEMYLTDVVLAARADGYAVWPFTLVDATEALGVNDPMQLADLERVFQRQQLRALQMQGLRVADPARIDIRGEVTCGQDCWVDPNVLFVGEVHLGDRVRVGSGAILQDAQIGDDVEILPYSLIEGARIAAGARIGPFARIRPGTEIGEAAHIGNYVEVKASKIGAGSKANHLSYIGDAEIGTGVNVGAGTITCNYDGANKHRTIIGNDVFIGSDSQLVAPVIVGDGATIGAGSTITKEVPAGGLTLSRSPQRTILYWQRPRREKK
ncbi:bifunctional UDP-N-acetylglucosamine diphosphorylase/glucosamine-1-phosphate N-acetyltransferase GlmU [Acidithiobacillus ferriphilus]|uniref:bifunctional UDP-N-acetylglucosamine diphosphorylase/glucosamine-1-phosphate N-acetyltransferase GlmU n=1 Tax=Acidithiobacillus ferriphilus TaxID=1689834 RepID=UPI001C0724F9|nr:bifunctional UDP-N-acetylglucosamine diphosphorylase/glucosamine-1-phosphate N-acetyltransferase GlmU [Acidithiobacillus ferriphilus]MBU2847630.1 bifunctional UDP-N-acetylglucosamine diphosphorylase/glucosamine-1-phosphate N-acetyltransferase GlmU [Acidithiobacillus ferriphilus]